MEKIAARALAIAQAFKRENRATATVAATALVNAVVFLMAHEPYQEFDHVSWMFSVIHLAVLNFRYRGFLSTRRIGGRFLVT